MEAPNKPSCRLLHDVNAMTGTCSRSALDANIEHGASLFCPDRWDGGESYKLAGVSSILTSGTKHAWAAEAGESQLPVKQLPSG